MDYIKALPLIIQNTQIGPGFYDMRVDAPEIVERAGMGQFVHIYCEGKTLRRPISICGIDKQNGILRMVYEVRGEGTQWLSTLPAGYTLDIVGPLGQGFKLLKAKNIVVVGGGIGLPPLLPVAEAAGGSAAATVGFRTKEAAILIDDFMSVCKEVHITSDDGTLGRKGVVTTPLEKVLSAGGIDLVCACGPMPMLKAICELTARHGVDTQVSLEQRMGCGIGACLVCSCKANLGAGETYVQVCRNGPVFNAKEVVW